MQACEVIGASFGESAIPKEDLPYLTSTENMERKIYYRTVWKRMVLQSLLYCRLTQRNNYSICYNGGYGFIKYFLVVKDVHYAVIQPLVCENVMNGKIGDKKIYLNHIAVCKKKTVSDNLTYLNIIENYLQCISV